MEAKYKMRIELERKECIFFVCMIMLNKLILNLPTILISSTGTGTFINLIYIGIITLFLIFIINICLKNFPNSDILDISNILGGKFLKIIVGVIFIALFSFILFTFLTDFANLLKMIYYQNSPKPFILLFFIIGILVSNLIGFKSIIRMISFLFPFVLLSIFTAFIGTIDNFSIDKITPVLGYNYQTTFINGLLNIFSFSFISFYYFLQPLLKEPTDFKKISYISFFISFGLLFITVCSILTLLPLASTGITINPLYLLSRNVSFSDFLQRLDGIFVLFWILSLLCYLSSLVFFTNLCFSKIVNISDNKMFTYITCMLLFGFSLLPFDISTITFLETSILKYMTTGIVFIMSPIILILAMLKEKFKVRKGVAKNAIIKN